MEKQEQAQLITNINLHLHNHRYHTETLTLNRIRKYRKKLVIVEEANNELSKEASRLKKFLGRVLEEHIRLRKERQKFKRSLYAQKYPEEPARNP